MDGFLIVLGLLVLIWLASRLRWRPGSIGEAPAGSFLAYGRDGSVEYVSEVSNGDAEECAADRLCEAGGCVKVEHKFEDGSTTVFTPDRMRELGW